MKREDGFYWVRHLEDSEWTILYYSFYKDVGKWYIAGNEFPEIDRPGLLFQIDETQIKRHE